MADEADDCGPTPAQLAALARASSRIRRLTAPPNGECEGGGEGVAAPGVHQLRLPPKMPSSESRFTNTLYRSR